MGRPRRRMRDAERSSSLENGQDLESGLNSGKRLKILYAKRQYLLDKTQNVLDLTEKFPDEHAIEEFKTSVKGVGEVKMQFERLCDEINYAKLEINADSEIDYTVLDEFNQLVRKIELANSKLEDAKRKSTTVIKLPRLELPAFDGDLSKWALFKETFEKVVHQNDALSPQEKVQFLLGKLSGRALQTISSLPATGENYETMWNRLNAKYHDKTKLSKFYVNQMFSYKTVGHESGQALENFLENFAMAYEGLQNTKLPCLSDFIILQLALTKLDSETVKNFEMFVRETEIPTFEQLRIFLQQQSRILNQSRNTVMFKSQSKNVVENKRQTFMISKADRVVANNICKFCKIGVHHLYECRKFLSAEAKERFNFVKANAHCFNCLSSYHVSKNCKSVKKCSECSGKHHSLLHLSRESVVTEAKETPEAVVALHNQHEKDAKNETVLLATALVSSGADNSTLIRVLLDSASQSNLISDKCRKRLGLRIEECDSSLHGLGNSPSRVLGKTLLNFASHFDKGMKYSIEVLVVDKISGRLPSVRVRASVKERLANFKLADFKFDMPGEVEVLIGAELYPKLMKQSVIPVPDLSCHLLDTTLGFVLMGKAPTEESQEVVQSFHICEEPLELLMKKFWEVESFNESKLDLKNEAKCEELFAQGVSRDHSGRFMVKLPFLHPPSMLGNSSELAKRRFISLETKLNKNKVLKLAYQNVIKDFLDRNYLVKVTNADNNDGVWKESASTPLRVVFDASAKTTSGKSLNDILHIGAKLHSDPISILLNFKLFEVVITADIKKMYMQILLHPSDRKYQRIFWRDDANAPIQVLEMARVAFGLRSSPFLAMRVVQKLIEEEGKRFPLASQHVPQNMYVDDIIFSTKRSDVAFEICKELELLFAAGGFEVSKWRTNSRELFDKISSWAKLLRIVCYVLKFAKKLSFTKDHISANELTKAEKRIIKINQKFYFAKDMQLLENGQPIKSALLKLRPFLDDGLLRVGGRLRNSELSFGRKFPVVVPGKSNIATLIIDYYHITHCHPGTNTLISLIRHKFWIINIRQIVKKRISRCLRCFKVKPLPGVAQMADLPKCRVTESRVFEHTGVDYAGPFYIILKRARGQHRNKVWVCLFVCMATKAVHLEVCMDLSTQSFLDALTRFVSRRGPCSTLYSDQGTNFCGASNLLKELYSLINSDTHKGKWGDFLAEHRITWKFNPPGAPHFGGLWESLVKGFKRHLLRTIGEQTLTLEEFQTVCMQIEAILNSRPITPLSEDPAEPCPLTPAHFLIGKPLTQFPIEMHSIQLGRPRLMQTIITDFWKRWKQEYLHNLQTRQKWLKSVTPVMIGRPVLLIDPNMPPLSWPLGIIEEVFPAGDGQIRVVKVRTNKGAYIRPVVKVCPLPVD